MQSSDNKDIHKLLFSLINETNDDLVSKTLEGIILSNIINFSDDAIFSTTLDGIITSWNRAAEKIFGFTRTEIIGKHINSIIPTDRREEEPKIIERIKQGEYVQHYETERLRKDRTTVCISLTVSPLKDSRGEIIGISKISRDITASRKLRELQTRMADIINHSDDAIISISMNEKITSWNRGAEKIFGYSESDILGKPYLTLVPESRADELPKVIELIKQGSYVQHYTTQRIRKDNSIVNISLTVSPIKNARGEITGISKIARDITSQVEKDAEIQEKNKELEAYSYSVSHDLRAPLRRIIQYVEILQEDHIAELSEEGRKLISKIDSNTIRMWKLIDDLLAFSQTTRQDIVRTNVDLKPLVTKLVDEAVPSEQQGRIHLDIKHLGRVLGDSILLRQVIQNLLDNAIKYTSKNEKALIEIGSFPEDVNKTVVYVKDNGVGFDMRYSNKLFNVFQRLHTENEFKGTGIGLAIVKHIITKHGGRVWAESELNKGATFFFSLPNSH